MNFLKLLFLGFAIPAFAATEKIPYDPKTETFTDVSVYSNNLDAFRIKQEFIRKSGSRIEMTYFIIDHDPTSALLMLEVLKKADVGVKVKILVDYFMSQSQLPMLLFLDGYKTPDGEDNIEVKRFGPPTESFVKSLQALHINPAIFTVGLMEQNAKMLVESFPEDLKLKMEELLSEAGLANEKAPSLVNLALVIKEALKSSKLSRVVRVLPTFTVGFRHFLARTHHKLLLVDVNDGIAAKDCFVMGGRNLSDEYHAELDDVLIQGNAEIPKRTYAFQDMDLSGCQKQNSSQRLSFARLWKNERSVGVAKTVAALKVVAGADKRFAEIKAGTKEDLEKTAAKVKQSKFKDALDGGVFSDDAVDVGTVDGLLVENTADMADDLIKPKRNSRQILDHNIRLLNSAGKDDDVVIANAYFYINKDWIKNLPPLPALNLLYTAFTDAADRGAAITIHTNSAKSTDLSMVNDLANETYGDLLSKNIKIKELTKEPKDQGSLHMKAAVFYDTWIAVGSANLDPRSDIFDTNNVFLFKDPGNGEKAREITRRIHNRNWSDVTPATLEATFKSMTEHQKSRAQKLFFVRDQL